MSTGMTAAYNGSCTARTNRIAGKEYRRNKKVSAVRVVEEERILEGFTSQLQRNASVHLKRQMNNLNAFRFTELS